MSHSEVDGARFTTASPSGFWLGLFLVLYSAGYLSMVLRLKEVGLGSARFGILAWVALGLALFAAGSLTVLYGRDRAATRSFMAAAAGLYAFRVVSGILGVGNPFAGAASIAAKASVGLGLVADVLLALAALWFLVTVARTGARDGAAFRRGAIVFLATLAFQAAIAPMVAFFVYLLFTPGALSGFTGLGRVEYTVKTVPTLLRGAAGIVALVAAHRARRSGGPVSSVAWALGLWAVADLALAVALWVGWLGAPPSLTSSLVVRLRTTLLVSLPALALLSLAWTVKRESRAG